MSGINGIGGDIMAGNLYKAVFNNLEKEDMIFKNKKEADTISRGLLEAKLIACANTIEGIQSFFWWQDKIDSSKEALLILKTKKTLFKKIVTKVKALHSYQTPEIIAIPIVNGSKDYLGWISFSVV